MVIRIHFIFFIHQNFLPLCGDVCYSTILFIISIAISIDLAIFSSCLISSFVRCVCVVVGELKCCTIFLCLKKWCSMIAHWWGTEFNRIEYANLSKQEHKLVFIMHKSCLLVVCAHQPIILHPHTLKTLMQRYVYNPSPETPNIEYTYIERNAFTK